MNKRNIAKLEKLVETLKTASPREGYEYILQLQEDDVLEKISDELVKKDFILDPYFACKVIYRDLLPEITLSIADGMYVDMFPYFSDSELELKIIIVGLENELKKIDYELKNNPDADVEELFARKQRLIYFDRCTPCFASHYREFKSGTDYLLKLPVELISKLPGFCEEAPDVWVYNIGNIENVTQLKKKALPVWKAALEVLKSFEEE